MNIKGKHTRQRLLVLGLATCLVCICIPLAIGAQHKNAESNTPPSSEPTEQKAEQSNRSDQAKQGEPNEETEQGEQSKQGEPDHPTRTATGEVVDGSSMGGAIPLSTPNFRSYFGRAIQITYDGKTVMARINDCGALSGRSLDLQPGVIRALGFNDCPSWGTREVSYRIL